MTDTERPNVLITGASGLVGSQVVRLVARDRAAFGNIIALDIREVPEELQLDGVQYVMGDICDEGIVNAMAEHGIDAVVHLAAILSPGNVASREMEYKIDVLGTENLVNAAVATGVGQFVFLSSGAAYGYHADNPVPLTETDELRGNEEFSYSWHKRLVEEMLARARIEHPQLKQLIFRPGTILGASVKSPVSAIFERAIVTGIAGSDSPFVLIWDEDVAAAIVKGVKEQAHGIYNLAGDGALSLREIAKLVGKPFVPFPSALLRGILWGLHQTGLSDRGPEGVDFLQFRPVLANQKLKDEFGFIPSMTSAEVFRRYCGSLQDN
jgi:UDP-glucose 4-epimerase